MYRALFAVPLLLAAVPCAAVGQRYPSRGGDTGRDYGGPADTSGEVAAANRQAASAIDMGGVASAEDRAAYQAELDDYQQANRVRAEVIRHNELRSYREQQAYQRALATWQEQVEACRHGDARACRAPTPWPGDYM